MGQIDQLKKMILCLGGLVLFAACSEPDKQAPGSQRVEASSLAQPDSLAEDSAESTYTLRLILDGLIAIVPDSAGNGMTALTVKDASGHHNLIVGALRGAVCSNDCKVSELSEENLPFIWRWPGKEQVLQKKPMLLSIHAGGRSANLPVNMVPPMGFKPPSGKPGNFGTLQSLDWLQSLADISPSKVLKEGCLDSLDCGVVAAIPIPKAREAGVCRFSYSAFKDMSIAYDLFKFRRPNGMSVGETRALAGSVLFELEVPRDLPILIQGTRVGDENPVVKASLKPGPMERSLTLVFSNSAPASSETVPPVHDHFRMYYGLTADKRDSVASEILIPERVIGETGPVGMCDPQIVQFNKDTGLGNGGLNPRECDLVKIPSGG